jgi:hypothetical protein
MKHIASFLLTAALVATCASFSASLRAQPSSPAAAATAAKVKEPLTVVYWTARDCRWCTWWEGKFIGSGGEAKFLASPEGKVVRYIVVKKPLLSVPYQESDFNADTKWLWERMQASKADGEGRIRGFPSFSLFEGKTLVTYALGEPDVEKKLIPAIREKM